MSRGDTIARYDSSMDKFSTRTPVRPTPLPSAPVKLAKDSMAIKTSVGKQPVIMAKPAADIRLPGAHAEIAARAGKFIFLAIALPSYIALYTIPKWILTGALPFLFQKAVDVVQYTLQHLNKAYQLVVHALAETFRTIKGTINWSLKGMEGQSTAIFSYLREKMTSFQQAVVKQLKKATEAITHPFKRGYSFLHTLILTIAQAIAAICRKVITTVTVVVKAVFFNMKSIYNAIAIPLKRWISPKLQWIKNTINSVLCWILNRTQALVNAIHKALAPLTNTLNRLINKITRTFSSVITPIKNPLFSLFNGTLSKLKTIFNKIHNRSLQGRHKARNMLLRLHTTFIRTARQLNDFLENLYTNRKTILTAAIKWIFRILPIIPIFFLIIRWIAQKLLFILRRLAKRVEKVLLPLLIPLVIFVRTCATLLRRLIHTTFILLKKTLSILQRPLIFLTKNIYLFVITCTKEALQLLSWCGLLLKFWMHLVVEIASSIETKFHPEKK